MERSASPQPSLPGARPAGAPGEAAPEAVQESDETLMERYRDGDASAFEILYRRHRAPLYRYVRRQCRSAEAADEIFQDVWMGLIAARARYAVRAKFSTYLYRIAHHRLVDEHRRAAHRPRPVSELGTEDHEVADDAERGSASTGSSRASAPERELDAARARRRLREALDALPRVQADAFLLHEEAGLSLEEIAALTGVGRETVKSRLRYALAKLRRALESP